MPVLTVIEVATDDHKRDDECEGCPREGSDRYSVHRLHSFKTTAAVERRIAESIRETDVPNSATSAHMQFELIAGSPDHARSLPSHAPSYALGLHDRW